MAITPGGHFNNIEEAYRYYENARGILLRIPIQYSLYTDSKRVAEAAATGYLSALIAINAYLLIAGVSSKELPKSIEHYWDYINRKIPHNGKLKAALAIVYQNLHLLAYYHGGTNVEMVKAGFGNCKKIIDMMASSIRKKNGGGYYPQQGTISSVEEPRVHYRKKRRNMK